MLTDQPMRNTVEKYKSFERILNWAAKLAPYRINYEPRKAIKVQALANFVAECSVSDELKIEDSKSWMLYVD